MIHLSNGAKVHAAFVLPKSPGLKPRGLVLAETKTDWVTWGIYWDGGVTLDLEDDGQPHEEWEAEQGHYFQKSMHPTSGCPVTMARFDFGLRLRHEVFEDTLRGLQQT